LKKEEIMLKNSINLARRYGRQAAAGVTTLMLMPVVYAQSSGSGAIDTTAATTSITSGGSDVKSVATAIVGVLALILVAGLIFRLTRKG
jgi:cobalamin biosynthesis Mg chelatase CobN